MKKIPPSPLREATIDDAEELARLLSATFQEAYAGVHSSKNIRTYCESNYSADEVRDTLQDASVEC